MGKRFEGFTTEALSKLMQYNWPGNIRELENLIEQSVILHSKGKLNLSRKLEVEKVNFPTPFTSVPPASHVTSDHIPELVNNPQQVERQRILAALIQTKGRVSGQKGAAKLLNMKASTLEYRIKKLQLIKEHALIKAGQY